MSIKTQKILKYIPIINFLIMFIWIGTYSKHISKPSRFIKNLLKMFFLMLIINLPRIIIYRIGTPEFLMQFFYFISLYLTMFSIAYIGIKDQEKFIAEEKKYN